MPRKLVAVRVEPVVVEEFRKLARTEGLGLGFAVQRLMESALTCSSVNQLSILARQLNPRLQRANVSKFKAAMVRLSGEFRQQLTNWVTGDFAHPAYTGSIEQAVREIQNLIPFIDDIRLLSKAGRLIAESIIFVKATEIKEAKVRRGFLAEAEKITEPISPELRKVFLMGPKGSESDEET